MSYSKLASYVKLSPNCTKPRSHAIDCLTIHHMAGNLSVETCGNVFAPTSRQASSNYGIGSDGRIACYVEEENRSWCSGSRENDHRAITIEVANCTGAPDWKISDAAYKSLIELCVDICQRYGFTLNYTGDKTGNLTMHKWFQATACPGPYLEKKFPAIAKAVNARLQGTDKPAQVKKENEDTTKENKEEFKMNMRNLRKGCTGEDVRALQILLIGRGYSCGGCGADGDFGSATDAAVRAYQKAKALGVDGIAGPATMGSLLGV